MKQLNKHILSVSVLAALASNQLVAESFDVALFDTGVIPLEDIEVTALRAEKSGLDLRDVDLVSEQQLAEQQPESIPAAVDYLPNVTAVGGPRDSVHSVNIRGLDDKRVLQLVDGVRQNFESGHRPTYFLDPALVKNIEVIKGPVSSLWGSGALGGVVSSNTIHASDLLGSKDWGGFIKGGYQTNSDKWLTTLATARRFGNVDVLLSGYYSEQNNYELGNGNEVTGSEHQDDGLLAKVDWFIDDAQMVTFNLRNSNVDGQIPSNGQAEPNDTSNFLLNRDSRTQHASVDYRFSPESSLIDSQFMVYWNNNEVAESRVSDGRNDVTEIETIGLNINNRSQFGNINVLYGVDGYQDKLDANRSGANRPIAPEATTEVWGAFAQIEVPLATNWLLNVGTRYDYFSTEADNLSQDRSDNAWSPSVALKWQTLDNLAFTARYDEAFRAPSSEELYTTGTHFCYDYTFGWCNTFVANPNLEAEEAQNVEFLVDYELAGLFTQSDKVRFNATFFKNDIDNFIEQNVSAPTMVFFPSFSMSGTTTYNNVEDAELKGFEVSADYQLNGFRAIISYGQTRGEDKNTGNYLSSIPADKWVLDLSQVLLQGQVKLGMRATFAESQDLTPDDDVNDYERYNVADVYARWQPTKDLTLDLSVNNLTDQHYRVAFEELYKPGRDVRLAVKYDF
jgi:hemoglobin/transferrin/lactoferrin receptor protein